MILCDVNVLLYAHREDSPHHALCRRCMESLLSSPSGYGVSDAILASLVRIATHPRIFEPPSPLDEALAFAEQIRDQPNAVPITPGNRHWGIFTNLCRKTGARGNLVADAWLAALAIESGCTWFSTDRDFARFPGLDWRSPLDEREGA